MRRHGTHLWMCGAMAVVAVLLLVFTGSASAFLPLVLCMAMMGAMMAVMTRGADGRGRAGEGRGARHERAIPRPAEDPTSRPPA